MSLAEGESALLVCRVTANPPASLEWVRQSTGQVVGEGQEQLTLAPLHRSMADTYLCQARNPLGLSEPLAHTLNVLCKSLTHRESLYPNKGTQGVVPMPKIISYLDIGNITDYLLMKVHIHIP